jgi:hypothetical protein
LPQTSKKFLFLVTSARKEQLRKSNCRKNAQINKNWVFQKKNQIVPAGTILGGKRGTIGGKSLTTLDQNIIFCPGSNEQLSPPGKSMPHFLAV